MSSEALSIYEAITSIEDIQRFIDEREVERAHLDFKTKRDVSTPEVDGEFLKKIRKAVSGFSNSDGGVLVIGVKEIKDSNGKSDFQLDPIAEPAHFEQRVNEQISRATDFAISGALTKRIIDLGANERGYVILYIPKSELAPHRSKDDREYYYRSGDSFERMEHWQIADVFGRRHQPKMIIKGELSYIFDFLPAPGTHTLSLELSLINEGRGMARFPLLRLNSVPSGWGAHGDGAYQNDFGLPRKRIKHVEEYRGGVDHVIHAGGIQQVTRLRHRISGREVPPDYAMTNFDIIAELAAEGMPVVSIKLHIPADVLMEALRTGMDETAGRGGTSPHRIEKGTYEWRPLTRV